MKFDIRSIRGFRTRTAAAPDKSHVDMENRTVQMAYSSEMPVERQDWGGSYYEVLGHKAGEIDDSRMATASFLHNHNSDEQIGAVVDHKTPDTDGKSRATIKLSRSQAGDDALNDYQDGIRKNISVGYDITGTSEMNKEDLAPEHQKAITRNIPIIRCRWTPLELSDAPVPADSSVGAGRSKARGQGREEKIDPAKITEPTAEGFVDEFDEYEKDANGKVVVGADGQAKKKKKEVMTMATEIELKNQGAAELRKRLASIDAVVEMHPDNAEVLKIAREFQKNEAPLSEFHERVLKDAFKAIPVVADETNLGMSRSELGKYSYVKAIREIANAGGSMSGLTGLELECHKETEKKLRGSYKAHGFLVPRDVQRMRFSDVHNLNRKRQVELMQRIKQMGGLSERQARDLTTQIGTLGGFAVETEVMGQDLIEYLRPRMVMTELGASYFTGLEGNVAFPKQTGATSGYWVPENGQIPESDPTLGQVNLTPKTFGVNTKYGKQLLDQGSLDIEMYVRNDQDKVISIGLDSAALNGTGADGQPLGILNTPGLSVVSLGPNGGAPTWDAIVNMETNVASANADFGALSYLASPQARGKMKRTALQSGFPLYIWAVGDRRVNGVPVGMVNGYDALASNQVPSTLVKGNSGAICSALVYGNWESVMIAHWGVQDIVVDPYTYADYGEIRVVQRTLVDVGMKWIPGMSAILDMLTA